MLSDRARVEQIFCLTWCDDSPLASRIKDTCTPNLQSASAYLRCMCVQQTKESCVNRAQRMPRCLLEMPWNTVTPRQ